VGLGGVRVLGGGEVGIPDGQATPFGKACGGGACSASESRLLRVTLSVAGSAMAERTALMPIGAGPHANSLSSVILSIIRKQDHH
jgi:hypothetical protein